MNKQGRILVVEDESIIARDIALQLSDLGYAVLGPVSSGEQAIAMTSSLLPDLVLMDVHLAGRMDGIDAAQLIRRQYAVPSLFLSAFDGPDSLQRAKQCEPAGYLVKPFEDHQLRDAVATAFASLA
jgi:CheY-like chemotaxis protein